MGPLSGIRVLEFEAIGPGPFAGMLLADMGADVLVVDRPAAGDLGLKREPLVRRVDARQAFGDARPQNRLRQKEAALQLIGRADALIEGFRPGVMERLGLSPHESLERNPRLVYGGMTGWARAGRSPPRAGHDINYIALAGVLHAFGRKGEAPVPPLNLVGDFGGGGMLLGFGIACALLEAQRSGRGQVVDAAMVEARPFSPRCSRGFLKVDEWSETRGVQYARHRRALVRRLRDKDGKYVAIGAIEDKFFKELLSRLAGSRRYPAARPRGLAKMRNNFAKTSKRKRATSGARSSKAPMPACAGA